MSLFFDTYSILENQVESNQLDEKISNLRGLKADRFIFSNQITNILSIQELRWLESNGYSVTKFTPSNPLGTYAINDFQNIWEVGSLKAHNSIYRVQKSLPNGFGLVSKPPTILTQDQIDNHPFRSIPTNTMFISTWTEETSWSNSSLIPFSNLSLKAINTSNQYAQGGFEGAVVSVNSENEIFSFRPEENAKRLQRTCEAICMPTISTEFYLEAVRNTILSNSDYLPTPGSDSKLYIRPTVFGIDGGSGVAPANTYIFLVVVFPFTSYFSGKDHTVNLFSFEDSRRSTKGGVGHHKYSGNYGRTMREKMEVKKGINGIKYDDVFYLGDSVIKTDKHGNKIIKEVLEEDAAGCLIFWSIDKDTQKITLYTPSLARETILPSITRSSILTIGRSMGHNVIEKHMPFDLLQNMDGGMLVGSAAGAVRINSLTSRNQRIEFKSDENITKVFSEIYDLLYAVRRGETSQFADKESEIHTWPHQINKLA